MSLPKHTQGAGQALARQLGCRRGCCRRQLAGSERTLEGTSAWKTSPELVQDPALAPAFRSPRGLWIVQTIRLLRPACAASLASLAFPLRSGVGRLRVTALFPDPEFWHTLPPLP